MSRWLKAIAAAGCLAGLTHAPAVAAEPDRWAGPYMGLNLGYGFADVGGSLSVLQPNSTVPYATGPLSYGVDPVGSFAGLQLGINGPTAGGPFFSGLELDLQMGDITGTSGKDLAPPNIFAFNYRATSTTDWITTLRVRLGLATSNTLLYVTGGLAIGHVSYDATYLITDPRGPGGFANLKAESTQVGYVLGAGVEYALGGSWSLKLEYQYLNLGDRYAEGDLKFANGTPSNEKVVTGFSTELHTLRVGINLRLH